MKFKCKKDKKGEWRFSLYAKNGKVIATSEGYKRKGAMTRTINSMIKNVRSAAVEVIK